MAEPFVSYILRKPYWVKTVSIYLIVIALKRAISSRGRGYNGSLVESDYRRLFVMSVLPLCRSLYVNVTYYLPGTPFDSSVRVSMFPRISSVFDL